jgi:hypothetical protein
MTSRLDVGATAVCRMPSNTAARIGPIEGISQSRFQAFCFLLSANRSLRTSWCNALSRLLLLTSS